ncbi:HTH-type transcriptional regulator Xre [bacterium BMS3Bbin08]|nr:HTH-type transcriptional regulator Xre [bacterium BMS3Bbin08]
MRTKKIKTSHEIGGKIKKKRRELGISQEELAERLGVTYQQVQRYENGRNKLNVENIQVIADTLDVPPAYFFSDREKEAVSEELTPYLPAEESKLLGYFRKIRVKNSRSLVLQVARLAARANPVRKFE